LTTYLDKSPVDSGVTDFTPQPSLLIVVHRRTVLAALGSTTLAGCSMETPSVSPPPVSTPTRTGEPDIGLLLTNRRDHKVVISASVTERRTDEELLSTEVTLGTDRETISWYAPDAFRPEARHHLTVSVQDGTTTQTEVKTGTEGGLHFIAYITRDGIRFGISQS
jgi:hypothetical protein